MSEDALTAITAWYIAYTREGAYYLDKSRADAALLDWCRKNLGRTDV